MNTGANKPATQSTEFSLLLAGRVLGRLTVDAGDMFHVHGLFRPLRDFEQVRSMMLQPHLLDSCDQDWVDALDAINDLPLAISSGTELLPVRDFFLRPRDVETDGLDVEFKLAPC